MEPGSQQNISIMAAVNDGTPKAGFAGNFCNITNQFNACLIRKGHIHQGQIRFEFSGQLKTLTACAGVVGFKMSDMFTFEGG